MPFTKLRPPAGYDSEREVLDLEGYVPFLLSAVAIKWSRSSSRLYLEHFGVGITEWRMVSTLAIEPRITSNRICEVTGLDKAAASRSVQSLLKAGYLTEAEDKSDNRRQILELTPEGYRLHDRIMAMALKRARLLTSDLSQRDIETLTDLMRRLLASVPSVLDFTPEPPETLSQQSARLVAAPRPSSSRLKARSTAPKTKKASTSWRAGFSSKK